MPFSQVDASPDPEFLIDYLERAAAALEPVKADLRSLAAAGGRGPVLDLGCGIGHDLVAWAGAGITAVGVDASLLMLDRAASRAAHAGAVLRLAGARGEGLPFRSKSLAGCLADRVLQHVADPLAVLHEVERVLRPGARIAIFEPDWGSLTLDADDHEAVVALSAQLAASAPQRRVGLHLRRLLVNAGFVGVEVTLAPVAVTSLEGLGRLTGVESALQRIADLGVLGVARMEAFRDQLEQRSAQGTFFATLNRFIARAEAGAR
ncbi:MAG TPA: methyltransferase domain-containing protein [Acidimicrobiales bacterium]|nr:methyltransferase domain-containing protein [Acidimicrobiales bacterium]